jgi:hypothetical protein
MAVKAPKPPVLAVRDWNERHENSKSRSMLDTRWFPMPNDLSADEYVELVDHPEGAAHFGVLSSLLMVASRAKPRGTLVTHDGRPHDAESLARLTRHPKALVESAIERLLKIGLLELRSANPRRKSIIQRHPTGSVGPEGASERKGKEHHHQEGKGNEKEKEGKRTEPEGTESASAFSPESSGKAPGKNPSHMKPDDEETPGTVYASPEDELKALYRSKAREPITIDLLTAIRGDLESGGVSFGEFLAEVRKHSANEWRNPPGFLRSLSKRFRAKTRPASDPVTAAEAEEINYRCLLCDSRIRGHGARFVDGKVVPCSCASADYIAHQRERGVFSEEPPE